ncbi:hypothetical protein SH449x_000770 [Pirellulaceae bacterium SH449]
MVLDSKLDLLRFHFQITEPADWTRIRPAEVLAQPDIGEATLNHLRYLLAGQGLTLLDDQTPEFWQSRLIKSRLGAFVYSDEDRSVMCPFTILIDAQEQLPFTFAGLTADSKDDSRPIIVPTKRQSLGASHGDYSIEGHEGHVHIDRKSIDDCIGTVLGWGDRRDQFQRTLQYLGGCEVSAIVVEGSFGQCIAQCRETKGKSAAENKRIFHRQVLAWQQDFAVQWIFCDTRRFAEKTTFQILRRYFYKHIERMKKR